MMIAKFLFPILFLYSSAIDDLSAQAVGDGIRIDLSDHLSLDTDGGQLIKTLHAGIQSPGEHRIKLIAEGLSSGNYYYVFQSDNIRLSRKCLYLK
jgi:hypothetical protein